MIRSRFEPTPGLLVSVRSAEEAIEAVRGGAAVVDVKEPDRGPLGKASVTTWKEVRAVVPAEIPVSVALGELVDWDAEQETCPGIRFQKLGLAGVIDDWRQRWAEIRRLETGESRWVAVAYADWEIARSPGPWEVLEAAIEAADCSGVLVDTWDKTKPSPLGPTSEWRAWVDRAQQAGKFVALAGGLNRSKIAELATLQPDLFAVRGAACDHQARTGKVREIHVAELVQAIRASRP